MNEMMNGWIDGCMGRWIEKKNLHLGWNGKKIILDFGDGVGFGFGFMDFLFFRGNFGSGNHGNDGWMNEWTWVRMEWKSMVWYG